MKLKEFLLFFSTIQTFYLLFGEGDTNIAVFGNRDIIMSLQNIDELEVVDEIQIDVLDYTIANILIPVNKKPILSNKKGFFLNLNIHTDGDIGVEDRFPYAISKYDETLFDQRFFSTIQDISMYLSSLINCLRTHDYLLKSLTDSINKIKELLPKIFENNDEKIEYMMSGNQGGGIIVDYRTLGEFVGYWTKTNIFDWSDEK